MSDQLHEVKNLLPYYTSLLKLSQIQTVQIIVVCAQNKTN